MEDFNLDALVVFKLMNSEVIVCEIVSEDENQVVIRYAIRAIEMFTAEEAEVRFAPWIPFTDDVIILYRQGILAVAPPDDNMKEMYLNRMAELEAPAEQNPPSNEEVPVIRRQCRSHNFHKK